VSRVIEEWKGGRVLRLSLSSTVNQEYAKSIGAERTPTFVLFDAQGREVKRWVDAAPSPGELPDS
jgi:hypothetical protein